MKSLNPLFPESVSTAPNTFVESFRRERVSPKEEVQRSITASEGTAGRRLYSEIAVPATAESSPESPLYNLAIPKAAIPASANKATRQIMRVFLVIYTS